MTVKSKHRGHDIIHVEEGWVYADNNTLVSEEPWRKCGACDLPQTKEGHDGCLGTLPDVMNACCGHGEDKEAYVQFWDKSCIRGEEALEYQYYHKEGTYDHQP